MIDDKIAEILAAKVNKHREENEKLRAEIERLTRERDEARVERGRLRKALREYAARDALEGKP